MNPKKQDWDRSISIGEIAVEAVVRFFSSEAAEAHWAKVKLIEPVEHNPYYQPHDIDLVLIVSTDGGLRHLTVEVKGDRNDRTGNFFLETVSDIERNTPGAFVICKADWYFYYFVNIQRLYCIPMPPAQAWFERMKSTLRDGFSESSLNGRAWKTKGKLASIHAFKKAVPGTKQFHCVDGTWQFEGDERIAR